MYYEDNHIKIYNKDCRQMAELPDESVQCVVTSPPYWGLRKYSGEQELVWGNQECEHRWISQVIKGEVYDTKTGGAGSAVRAAGKSLKVESETNTCSLCGAWKGSYGLEPTPELYVQHTIEILREIRRVLRKDGVVFWNIGDSYASGKGTCYNPGGNTSSFNVHLKEANVHPLDRGNKSTLAQSGLKPKDLCLIPFRVALAAQGFSAVSAKEILYCADLLKEARESNDWEIVKQVENTMRMWSQLAFLDGMWARSDIIWSKSNPMPESVTDRPTNSHEHILMLTKSAKYYWDADAVREPHTESTLTRVKYGLKHRHPDNVGVDTDRMGDRFANPAGRNIRSVWEFPTQSYGMELCNKCKTVYTSKRYKKLPSKNLSHKCECSDDIEDYQPSWDLWLNDDGFMMFTCSICNREYIKEDYDHLPKAPVKICACGSTDWLGHFAVFPEKLPELCIKAATPEVGCCSKCGSPWARMVKKTGHINKREPAQVPNNTPTKTDSTGWAPTTLATDNWQPTCKCNADKVPSIVLDPFAGAGTSLWVAKKLNRRAVGYEISEEYCQLIIERTKQQVLDL